MHTQNTSLTVLL